MISDRIRGNNGAEWARNVPESVDHACSKSSSHRYDLVSFGKTPSRKRPALRRLASANNRSCGPCRLVRQVKKIVPLARQPQPPPAAASATGGCHCLHGAGNVAFPRVCRHGRLGERPAAGRGWIGGALLACQSSSPAAQGGRGTGSG